MSNEMNLNKQMELLKHSNGRGINYILNIAYEILGNPIIMNDTTYNLLAYTENTIKDDILWNELIRLGTFSHETVDFFSKEQFIDDVANTDVISVLKSSKLKYDRVNAKIFDKDDIHIANMCVVACYKPFETEDFKNIEIICEGLSDEIQKSEYYQKIERVFEETFVSKLIEEEVIDKDYIEDQMDELYTNLKNNLYIAVVDITNYEHTLTHLAYFRDLFKKLQNEFKYFIYLNNIVIIISTDNSILNIKRDLKELNDFFVKYNIFAGVSSSFQNLLELQKYYKQALNALNYGMNIDVIGDQHIFEYDNFRIDHFLNSVKNDVNIKDLCQPVIFLIQEYDKENNTSYFDILRTYLLVGGDSHLASKKMKIDHDELCFQLQKISETFGIDWNNGNMRLSIFISIKVLEYFFD